MSRIILPFANQESRTLVQATNRAVKEVRGKNQAFVICVINDDGTASVATNMDRQPQIVELLMEVLRSVKGH
jgi:uncharacterized protein GlcG (DUF336 family)